MLNSLAWGVKNRKSIGGNITNSIIDNGGVARERIPFVASHMPHTIRLIRQFFIAQETVIGAKSICRAGRERERKRGSELNVETYDVERICAVCVIRLICF